MYGCGATGRQICQIFGFLPIFSIQKQPTAEWLRFFHVVVARELYGLYGGSRTSPFQRTHYWTPKIQDGGDPLSWILTPKCKRRFSQKLSNLELWWLLTNRTLAFQTTHYWTSKIQDGWDPPSWKSTWRHFFSAEGWSPYLNKNSSYFDELMYTRAHHLKLNDSQIWTFPKLKMAGGRRFSFWP